MSAIEKTLQDDVLKSIKSKKVHTWRRLGWWMGDTSSGVWTLVNSCLHVKLHNVLIRLKCVKWHAILTVACYPYAIQWDHVQYFKTALSTSSLEQLQLLIINIRLISFDKSINGLSRFFQVKMPNIWENWLLPLHQHSRAFFSFLVHRRPNDWSIKRKQSADWDVCLYPPDIQFIYVNWLVQRARG